MEVKDIAGRSKRTLARATAAYATYESTSRTVRKMVEQFAHTLAVNEYEVPRMHEAACELVETHLRNWPGQRTQAIAKSYDEGSSLSDQWHWLPIPGVSRIIQVKALSGEAFVFRSLRKGDLTALRGKLDTIMDRLAAEQPEIEFDPFARPARTDILAWDSENSQWIHRRSRTSRSFESVVLPVATQEAIEDDLERFADSRQRLQRLEVPWRRGYLLSGPPGTGKTSVSLAIAASLRFNLASLSLTDMASDGMLRRAVSELQPRTVLVIEDIDAYSVSHDRDHNAERDGKLSLSGLLNSLDGFETPDGLVTIATTNHFEKLDPALVRSGRFDRMFHLGPIAPTELERLFAWFYERMPSSSAPAYDAELVDLSPAHVAELLKQHLEDPEAGWNSVLEHIANTPARITWKEAA